MVNRMWGLPCVSIARFCCVSILLMGFMAFGLPSWASQDAAKVYSAYEKSVYQIRIIELGSDSQSSIGTGFLVADGLLVATNYHVIASKVFEPEKYRIEADIQGDDYVFEILTFDATNDIALLVPREDSLALKAVDIVESVADSFTESTALNPVQTSPLNSEKTSLAREPALFKNNELQAAKPFEIEAEVPQKGETLFSLGNPRNIGMTVVEGNFNGMVEHRLLDQIHFSGAINPGMSGGPVLNGLGKVVGINVATAGNQIGFLVPAKALSDLLASIDIASQAASFQPPSSEALLALLGEQVASYTTRLVTASLAEPWEPAVMGKATIQSSPLSWLDCWGDSHRNKKIGTYTISRGCHSGSNIFLNGRLTTGYLEYEYMYFEAPGWPNVSMYDYLSRDTGNAVPANFSSRKHLGQFKCTDKQVTNSHNITARTSYCTRPYKKLPDLFDVFFMAVSVDQDNYALMSHYTLSGVRKNSAEQFLTHFLEVVAWAPVSSEREK